MATVKIKFVKHVGNLVRYVMRDKAPDDPAIAHDVDEQDPARDFEAVAQFKQGKGTVTAVHVIQSWSAEESKRLTPADFNAIGRQLVETKFPGHAFLVVTHTETGKTHNHIVVSPWHGETGKKIENKKRHLYEFRSISDTLCKERGLSVIDGAAKDRQARLPEKVQQMARFNGRSWLLDLCQKADFARAYATSYDEYVGILGEFGVTARVEEKNVSYFYGSKKRGKRGSKLGRVYDKAGLEEAFRLNDERFARHPELRAKVRGAIDTLGAGTADNAAARSALSTLAGSTYSPGQKDYNRFTKTARPGRPARYPHELDQSHGIIPIEEIRRARNSNIAQYCTVNKIPLTRTAEGRVVLQGREFVEIGEHEWVNRRNRTRGSLIEFVAAHRNMTFLQAIAEINGNPRLLLLERHLGQVKRSYTSFHIPRENRSGEREAIASVARLLKSRNVDGGHAMTLARSGQAQVSHSGVIRLFAKDDDSGAWEFTESADGKWTKQRVGTFQKPFFLATAGGKKVSVYIDPFSFLQHAGKRAMSPGGHRHDVLCLMEPDKSALDHFVAQNRHVTELHVVIDEKAPEHEARLDFFRDVKARYAPFGIDVKEARGRERAMDRGHDLPSM